MQIKALFNNVAAWVKTKALQICSAFLLTRTQMALQTNLS